MLADMIAGSRGFSGCALTLLLLFAACGCSITKEWPVYRAYEGNMHALNEVAVVIAEYGVRIEEVDGSWPYNGVPDFFGVDSSYEDTIEYHLLPGRHEITASYKRTDYFEGRRYSGDPTTIAHDLSAGTVYKLWAKTPTRYVYGGSRDYGVWSLDLFTIGPIDKAACLTTFDPPKQDPLVDFLSTIFVPPAHWVELRKLHCPEKVSRRAQ